MTFGRTVEKQRHEVRRKFLLGIIIGFVAWIVVQLMFKYCL